MVIPETDRETAIRADRSFANSNRMAEFPAMSSSSAVVIGSPRAPRVAALMAAMAFLMAGIVLIGAASLAFWAHISVQIVFNPFHRVMSVFLNTWELGGMLLVVGLWVGWTGHLLWHKRRSGYRSGIGILAVVFLRGALSLLPPIETGYEPFGVGCMLIALGGITLLSLARPALQSRPR